MLSIFYGQYRWLATGIVASSVEQHNESLAQNFERSARRQLQIIANYVARSDRSNDDDVAAILNRAIIDDDLIVGLRYADNNGLDLQSGLSIAEGFDGGTLWGDDRLHIIFPVTQGDVNIGILTSSFLLDSYNSDSVAFEERLVAQGTQRREAGFIWIGGAALLTLIVCGFVIWSIANMQAQRIRKLKVQAEKLRDADYGEPLEVQRGDMLGDLAAVFNDMREKLKLTTVSRDYVDSVLSSMNEAIIVTSAGDTITRVNAATTRLLGYSDDELLGRHIDVIFDQAAEVTPPSGLTIGVPHEARFVSKAGERVPVSYTSSSITAEGVFKGHKIYAAQNITERHKAEQRIRYLARIDALTKVPNRMQFQHLLQRSIARAKRAGRTVCLLYIDVDFFKEINDTFGHLAGDAALETVAERLSGALPDDGAIIGRLAGDEFAVILNKLDESSNKQEFLDKLASKLLNEIAEPFFVQGHEVFMTASMGIASYPADAPNVIDLIRNADAAMYHAKKSGGNLHAYYVAEMNEAAVARLMTKSKLKRAFERDELLVHYQPKYDLRTGEVFGAEALIRWELPERGIILPSDFIPIAEESNLIIEIGEWVLDRVCEDFRRWQQTVSSVGRISVNLSLKQLRQPNFIERISAILRSYEVSPTSLELEITETTLMENPDRTIKILNELYSLGLHLAIDDFGTGYSSLSALQQFPISTLKVDRSFVKDIAVNADDATIVGTIIHMGRSLKMDVVAEGVETEDQLSLIQSLDCTYVQGLLFGEPMSADNYLKLLQAQVDGTDEHRLLFG